MCKSRTLKMSQGSLQTLFKDEFLMRYGKKLIQCDLGNQHNSSNL